MLQTSMELSLIHIYIAYEDRHKKGDIIKLFFEEFCEEKLIQPTFIMDHPIDVYKRQSVKNGDTPSPMLRDRLDEGIALYKAGCAPKILMSGEMCIRDSH